MDDMANAIWTIVLIVILLIFIVGIIIILVTLNFIKRKKKRKIGLKANFVLVGIAYLIFATIFYFIGDYGKVFSFFFLPIFSVFTLILLEIADLFRKRSS